MSDATTPNQNSVLVIGGPRTGKTHYGGQLLGRVRRGQGQLIIRGMAASIAPLEEVFRSLAQGRAAGHTPMGTYDEVILPLRVSQDARELAGAELDLVWPDYDGEQVRNLVLGRRLSPDWQNHIQEARGWMLFIRPHTVHSPDDMLSRPQGEVAPPPAKASDREPSDAAFFVELLQILLFAKGSNAFRRLNGPRLVLLLSCWDEIAGDEDNQPLPSEVLRARLPLVSEFIASNWEEGAASIWGLSSLSKSLSQTEPDDDYMDLGPEHFGYVVSPDGTRSPDLTLPLLAALGGSV